MVPALLFCCCYCYFPTCFYIITASVDVAYTGIYNNYSMDTLSEADFCTLFVWKEQKSVVDYHTVYYYFGGIFYYLKRKMGGGGGSGGGGAVEEGGGDRWGVT